MRDFSTMSVIHQKRYLGPFERVAMKRTTSLTLPFFCAFLCAASALASEREFVIPLGERQLFLDDVDLVEVQNLARTMHQPEKRGAVIRPSFPWEKTLQTRSMPAWDEKEQIFKIWLITSTNLPGVAGTSFALSKDGLKWTKPILRQWELEGSRENNFIAVDPKMAWPENAIENVVYDPDDPDPERRFKGLLGAYDRRPMVSPDGVHWTLLDVPPISSQDESNLSYDRKKRLFILTVKHRGPYGRSVHLSTSEDFETWTKPVLRFHTDELDQKLNAEHIAARRANPKLQMQRPLWDVRDSYKGHTAEPKVDVYNMGLFRYESLYVGIPSMFHSNDNRWNQDGFHLIELVCSRDLEKFTRLGDRKTFIGPSAMDERDYDWTQLLGPSAPVFRGDELWFYYTGIRYRTQPKDAEKIGGAVCLAVLRRDGFISLDATDTEGHVETKRFEVPGGKLFVNADVTHGTLRVECLNVAGEVVATSEVLQGDVLHGEVKWARGELTTLKRQKTRLRFTLTRGSLYSYWFGE